MFHLYCSCRFFNLIHRLRDIGAFWKMAGKSTQGPQKVPEMVVLNCNGRTYGNVYIT